MVTITFVPQAWQNDYAVDVDPEGPTEFDVPTKAVRGLSSDTHASDDLRLHPNAPEWIKNWSGPFRIDFDEDEGRDLLAFTAKVPVLMPNSDDDHDDAANALCDRITAALTAAGIEIAGDVHRDAEIYPVDAQAEDF